MYYDYIIIGGGPTGLTLAWLYRKYRILLVEKESELGGCHRVKRVNGYFTEHGPRIYTSNYFAVQKILDDMGINFYNIFEPDTRTSFFQVMWEFLPDFTIADLAVLTIMYIYYGMINIEKSRSVTMQDLWPHLSIDGQNAIDRICRITDGAGADRYTVFEFFQLVNQNIFYKILQPKKPNDVLLFPKWQDALTNAGVTIWTSTHILKTNIARDNIKAITFVTPQGVQTVECGQVLYCTPITNYLDFIKDHVQVPIPPKFLNYNIQTQYNVYISYTFHYEKPRDIPTRYTPTDWGIEYLVLPWSDFESKTIVSAAVSLLNSKSRHTHLTANETTDVNKLGLEMVRQLQLPMPDVIIISPCNYYDSDARQWRDTNTAFIRTVEPVEKFTPIKNLANIGTQNGQYSIAFTSMESATQSAINYYNLHNQDQEIVTFTKLTSLNTVIYIFLILLILVLIFIYFF